MALFQCERAGCGHEEVTYNDRGRITEPQRCAQCDSVRTMKMLHNRSIFHNKQIIKMQAGFSGPSSFTGVKMNELKCICEQENPNAIPEGETPHSVTMLCFDEMVDTAKPGDRVTVTGVPLTKLSNKQLLTIWNWQQFGIREK